MKNCGCKPGTYDNGWKDVRSAECLKAEIRAFGRVIRETMRRWGYVL